MNWFKKNQAIALLVGIVLTGGIGGWLYYSELTHIGELKASIEGKSSDITRVQKTEPYPSESNLDEVTKRVKELSAVTSDVVKAVQAGRISGKELGPIDFQSELREFQASLVKAATADGKQVTLPENFAFGFSKFLTSLPEKEAIPGLTQQMEVVRRVVTTLMQSGVKGISQVQRLPWEDMVVPPVENKNKPVPKKDSASVGEVLPSIPMDSGLSQQYRCMPFVFKFSGDIASIRTAISDLSNWDKQKASFVVRTLEVKSLKPTAPTVSELQAAGADASAQPESTSSSATPSSIAPIVIFGNELVEVTVRVDYIDWKKTEEFAKVEGKKP